MAPPRLWRSHLACSSQDSTGSIYISDMPVQIRSKNAVPDRPPAVQSSEAGSPPRGLTAPGDGAKRQGTPERPKPRKQPKSDSAYGAPWV